MLRTALIVAGVLAVLIGIVIAIGYALPVEHVASASATFARPPDRMFDVISDVQGYPAWRSDVERVELLTGGPPKRWREYGSDNIAFETVAQEPPRRLVVRIADRELPFGGTWTYELAPDGSGTRVTITEHGEVYNPVFRFMSKFVFGHTATIDTFLRDLGRSAN